MRVGASVCRCSSCLKLPCQGLNVAFSHPSSFEHVSPVRPHHRCIHWSSPVTWDKAHIENSMVVCICVCVWWLREWLHRFISNIIDLTQEHDDLRKNKTVSDTHRYIEKEQNSTLKCETILFILQRVYKGYVPCVPSVFYALSCK